MKLSNCVLSLRAQFIARGNLLATNCHTEVSLEAEVSLDFRF
ncbi:hypothetical protein [Helicobacter sp. T3_23-1059]